MPLFGSPDTEKMKDNGNIKGLIKAVQKYSKEWKTHSQATQALVKIYKAGMLNQKHKQYTLKHRPKIIQYQKGPYGEHKNRVSHEDTTDHYDQSIRVNYSL
jgi:hypothetical protein